ncbi:hypothetical protein [Sedimenticola hydrogenitrophicus]|uniref:hypothetical protein n=1 Tax=Sedimenticola hydrogenitrophicus TaxID=2967975 RepID=UPI0023AF1C65|nr:hypothetical protein [Sedimenticola hydrogenitrophicus]
MDWSLFVQQLLLVVLLGGADRLRGDHYHLLVSGYIDRLIYGWLMAALFGHPWDGLTMPIVATMYLGMIPGWGEAIGCALTGRQPDPERAAWWQRGPLLHNAWLALFARGGLWGGGFVPLALFDPRLLLALPAYTVAMPLAVWITVRAERPAPGNWEHQEYLRGWIAGALIVGGLWLEGWYGLV